MLGSLGWIAYHVIKDYYQVQKIKQKKVKKVIKGLKKASKLHASQAKTLQGVLNGKPKSAKKKRPAR